MRWSLNPALPPGPTPPARRTALSCPSPPPLPAPCLPAPCWRLLPAWGPGVLQRALLLPGLQGLGFLSPRDGAQA